MTRFVLAFALLLSACVLDEATDEDIAEVESESALPMPVTELFNGQTMTVTAPANAIRYYKIVVPAGFDHVHMTRAMHFSGSAEMYMKRGALPTPTNYDCKRVTGYGCKLDYPAAGTYYVMLQAGASGYSIPLTLSYRHTYLPIANNYTASYWNQYGIDHFFKIVIPENVGSFAVTYTLDPSDDGKLDLVVKRGMFATDFVYNCKQWVDFYNVGSTATCTFTNPTAGTYYIGLLGYGTKTFGTFSARYKFALINAPIGTVAN
jgi:vibriolysin